MRADEAAGYDPDQVHVKLGFDGSGSHGAVGGPGRSGNDTGDEEEGPFGFGDEHDDA